MIVVDTITNKDGKLWEVKRELQFIGSFKFMSSSLGTVSNNLDENLFKKT